MNISFTEIRQREIINVYDGKKLGHTLDLVFDVLTGVVLGFTAPGVKQGFMKKSEDLFIPTSNIIRIGDDCILVKLEPMQNLSPKDNKKRNSSNDYSLIKTPFQNLKKQNENLSSLTDTSNFYSQQFNQTQSNLENKFSNGVNEDLYSFFSDGNSSRISPSVSINEKNF